MLSKSRPHDAGAADVLSTGDIEALIPEDKREAFKTYQQTLIDKGVNIGVGKEKSKFEQQYSGVPEEAIKLIRENKLSAEDLTTATTLLSQKEDIGKILEVFGADSLQSVLQSIAEQEEANMTEAERIQRTQQELETNYTALQKKYNQLVESKVKSETDWKTKYEKLNTHIDNNEIRNLLTSAAVKAQAYDPDDILARLQSSVIIQTKDGVRTPVVVDAAGTQVLTSDGEPMSVNALVEDFIEKRPYLAKSTAKPGTGTPAGDGKNGTASGNLSGSKFTAEQLKDSNFFQDHYNEIIEEAMQGKIKL